MSRRKWTLDPAPSDPYTDCMVNQHEMRSAPLDPRELERSLRPFGESRMLPRAAYTAGDVFNWERHELFDRGWTCVGLSEWLPEPGSQRAEPTGAGSTLLVRGRDGTLRAFANACRHRNHELLASGTSSELALIRCPYHNWTFHLDGTLNRAPGFGDGGLPGFDPADNGLIELAAEEWHGLIFVHGSAAPATSIAEHLTGLDDLVAPYEMGRLRVAGSHDYIVAANWKVLSENYQECYHCPVIHPELCRVSPPDSGANYVHPASGAWIGGWQEVREHAATMSLDGTTSARPLRGLDDRQRRQIIYVGVFPNVLISLHPDYVMTHLLTPLAADRTRIRCHWAFAPEDLARPGFDPSFAVDFWDVTNRQDWLACESVQRGLTHDAARPGLLARDEDAVYQFVTMVARGYAGLPLITGPVAAGLA
jgi:Rieske 2Fe-2S family protein